MNLNSSFFKCDIQNGIAHLILSKPGKANAMSPDFWEDLPRLAREVETDPSVRVMVISGSGKHFTAGMDLSAFHGIMALADKEPARGALALRELVLKLQDSFTALEKVRYPVIAAIHGACIGGGIDFVTACDIRIMSKDAYFSIEEINIGMTADVGTLQRLPKLVPPGIVRELAYTGRRFSAEEAFSWGLGNQLCENQEETLSAAMAMAREIAAKSPLGIAGTKQAISYARDHTVTDSLEQIATWNAGMLRGQDLSAALQARMAKKAAVFEDLLAPTGSDPQ